VLCHPASELRERFGGITDVKLSAELACTLGDDSHLRLWDVQRQVELWDKQVPHPSVCHTGFIHAVLWVVRSDIREVMGYDPRTGDVAVKVLVVPTVPGLMPHFVNFDVANSTIWLGSLVTDPGSREQVAHQLQGVAVTESTCSLVGGPGLQRYRQVERLVPVPWGGTAVCTRSSVHRGKSNVVLVEMWDNARLRFGSAGVVGEVREAPVIFALRGKHQSIHNSTQLMIAGGQILSLHWALDGPEIDVFDFGGGFHPGGPHDVPTWCYRSRRDARPPPPARRRQGCCVS